MPSPPQTPHSSLDKHEPSSVLASGLKLHANSSMHPYTGGTYSAVVNSRPRVSTEVCPSSRHCMFHVPLRIPRSPFSSSATVNCPTSTFPSSPATAPAFASGMTYQLPPVVPAKVKPEPKLNVSKASDIPIELTSPSELLAEPTVNQLSYAKTGNIPNKNSWIPEPKSAPPIPTGCWKNLVDTSKSSATGSNSSDPTANSAMHSSN